VAAVLGLPPSAVLVTRVTDNATGAVLFSTPVPMRRQLQPQQPRGLQGGGGGGGGGGAVVAVRATTGAPNSGGGGAGAASSSSQAALLGSVLSGAAPLPAAAAAQLNGSLWGAVAAAAGVPVAALSAAVVAGSVAFEPSFAPFVASTQTATPSSTPIVTGLAPVSTVLEDPAKLSSFAVAGAVAAGIFALLLGLSALLCAQMAFCRLCCSSRKAAAAADDPGAGASSEHRKVRGRGPLVLGRRESTAAVDGGSFGGANPLRAGGAAGGSRRAPRLSVAPTMKEAQRIQEEEGEDAEEEEVEVVLEGR